MTDIILHHYATSPFSEKIRLVLGHKKLAWKSVIIPSISPKPEMLALTGGYRKTPILQIGADVYCDSALICDVLEHLPPTTRCGSRASGCQCWRAFWMPRRWYWTGWTAWPHWAMVRWKNILLQNR